MPRPALISLGFALLLLSARGRAQVDFHRNNGLVIVPGPLNFQVTDALVLQPGSDAAVRSVAVRDLNGDAYPETVLTLTAPSPSTTPIPAIIVEASGGIRVATAEFFPTGAPAVRHSPVTLFADINSDGLQDLLFAEAGSDMAPQNLTAGIGVALAIGGGRYRDVSSLVPADLQTTRSYALAVGDIDGDGRPEILLPDGNDGAHTALLRWNGNGFDAQENWIASSLWRAPAKLVNNSWMVLEDLDKDGRLDLVAGAASAPCTPTLRILFGAVGGYTANGLFQLPDGVFSLDHCATTFPVAQNVDVGPVVVTDFNNDGFPDIFATVEQTLLYQPGVITDTNEPGYEDIRAHGGTVYADIGIQVLMNRASRQFADVTSESTAQNLGRRHYFSLSPIDMNNDGFRDVVGLYNTDAYGSDRGGAWRTTVFLNDGTGAFQVVDGAQVLGNLGSFVPTMVRPGRTEGIFFEMVPTGAPPVSLNLYKVVADNAIGTGPGFQDSAALGVPGFNEFYYLRHYPDARAALQAGQYPDGLAHYLAVGINRGYLPHAPAIGGSALTSTVVGSTVMLSWRLTSPVAVASYTVEAGSVSGATDLASFDTGSPATTLTVPNVRAGIYYVRFRARSAAGLGPASNEIVVSVGGSGCGMPGPPTNLGTAVSGSVVDLTWEPPRAGCPVTSYVIEAGSSSGLSNLASVATGSPAVGFAATAVPRGTYLVRVRARSAVGLSPPSNEVVVNVGEGGCAGVPGPPTNLGASVSGSTVTLTWASPSGGCPVTTYVIEAGSSPGLSNLAAFATGNPGPTFSATGVPGGTYFVRVKATTTAGTGAPSNEVVVAVGQRALFR